MAQQTFTIPDKFVAELLNGCAAINDYDVNSGLTKVQFFRQQTYKVWRAWFVMGKNKAAADAAKQAAITETADFVDIP